MAAHLSGMWRRTVSCVGLMTLCVSGCASEGAGTAGPTATTQPTPSSETHPASVPEPTSTQGPAATTLPTAATSASNPNTSSTSGGVPSQTTTPAASEGTTTSNELSAPSTHGVESSEPAPSSDVANGETSAAVTDAPGETSGPSFDDPTRAMTIWIAGDSTVANGNTPCPTGWGKHLGSLFNEHVTIRNSAAGGRSVRTWMYEVSTEMGPDGECLLAEDAAGNPNLQPRWQDMLDNMKAGDALLIQFGINDGSPTCDRHVGLQAFKDTYGVLVDAAKERGVQAVLLTPVSAISCNGSTPQGTRGGFVDATIEAGSELGVPVLDLHARSVERYAELGFCPVAGGDVSAATGGAVGDYFCDDHTHFSSSGAADIAALVVELMVDADVPFTSHLK